MIRRASQTDLPAIERVVTAAYERYIPRIGKLPGPMNDDYGVHIALGNVWVSVLNQEIVGIVVLVAEPDYLLLNNVAVLPEKQGLGLGRGLIAFAEAEARKRGYGKIQLYTNELMHENLTLYVKLGYQEICRRVDAGFKRVFMRKDLP